MSVAVLVVDRMIVVVSVAEWLSTSTHHCNKIHIQWELLMMLEVLPVVKLSSVKKMKAKEEEEEPGSSL